MTLEQLAIAAAESGENIWAFARQYGYEFASMTKADRERYVNSVDQHREQIASRTLEEKIAAASPARGRAMRRRLEIDGVRRVDSEGRGVTDLPGLWS